MAEVDIDTVINNVDESFNSLNLYGLPGQMIKTNEKEIQNNAGGYVYGVDDLNRIRRFLILGTEGGTFYCKEKELAYDNLNAMINIIRRGKGYLLLKELVDISVQGRAPKQAPTLLCLALCCKAELFKPEDNWTDENKSKYLKYTTLLSNKAYKSVSKVCRIPTHLFDFVSYCELICKSQEKPTTGWGKKMKKMISEWYLNKPINELVLHITKYQQRNGWSHKDLLRLSHVKPLKGDDSLLYDHIFNFIIHNNLNDDKNVENYQPPTKIGKYTPNVEDKRKNKQRPYEFNKNVAEEIKNHQCYQYLQDYLELKSLSDKDDNNRVIELIKKHNFTHEHVPNDYLNKKEIWQTLFENIPMTALLRNLSKLSSIGIFDDNNEYVKKVEERFTNKEMIKKSRLHPLTILNGLMTYEGGQGIKGKLTWKVNKNILKSLNQAFYLSFNNVEPTNKKYCLAFDISGSMTCPIMGTSLSCRSASSALGMVYLKTETNVKCLGFSHTLIELNFNKEMSLEQIMKKVDHLPFGATNCALPMLHAKEKELDFDVFIVFTDCETYEGNIKAVDALKMYRRKMNKPNAKLIVMGMTSTEFTIADPDDKNMLDVVGFDTAVPDIVRSFVLDEI